MYEAIMLLANKNLSCKLFGSVYNWPLFFCILLLFSIPSFALPTDKTQPVYFNADTVSYNHTTGVGIYTGHVKIIQGSTQIIANQVMTYSNQQNQVQKAVAIGTPAQYQTQPKPNQALIHANASVIEYYPQQRVAILKGNASVIQNKNVLKSPWISYDMKLDKVKTGTKDTKQRTTIVFQPESIKQNP
jgi:lipopolysaccharide export system protein LptA